MDINKMTALQLQNSFYYDDVVGVFISDELELEIDLNNRNNILQTKRGYPIKPHFAGTKRRVLIHGAMIDFYVLLKVVTDYIPNELEDVLVEDLETYNLYSNSRTYNAYNIVLVHRLVDITNPITKTVYLGVPKAFAQKLLECKPSMIWDLIYPTGASINHKGYFLRSHIPGSKTFIIEDEVVENTEEAEHIGVFLLVDVSDAGVVYCVDSLYAMVDIINENKEDDMEDVTVEDILEFFRSNNPGRGFHGWKIRRIDDIYGQNIRFATVM